MRSPIQLSDIEAALTRIRPQAKVTPLLTFDTLNEIGAADVRLKCELFQPVGAFKIRGAMNALRLLSPAELENGVVTESSGNHAQAIAFAARELGVPAHIVMPTTAPRAKVSGVQRYGGRIYHCEPNEAARKGLCQEVQAKTGATLIHPFNDARVIAGQGTVALEILEQLPECQTIVVPVGGGGIISGIAIAAKAIKPSIKIIGVEPEGADDLKRSLAAGTVTAVPGGGRSIAEGLLATVGQLPFEIIQSKVDSVVTVSDAEIAATTLHLFERAKLVVEPSGATALAALMHGKVPSLTGPVAVVITGGNLDADRYAELARL